jgi:hypothetical protein
MLVELNEAHQKIWFHKHQAELQISLISNLMRDQLNLVKYSLMGNNYNQKQMADIVKSMPLLNQQLLREKADIFLFT